MKKLVYVFTLLAVAVALTIVMANESSAQGTPGYGANVFAGVKTDKSAYAIGEPVHITFIVQNRSSEPVTYRFPSSKQYEVWVTKDGKEVWRSSHGMMYAQALTNFSVPAGELKKFEVAWKQIDNEGKPVGPGAYTIKAQITPMGSTQGGCLTESRIACVMTRLTVGSGPKVVPSTISAVTSNLSAFKGKLVSIEGVYRGWKPDRESRACKAGPPVSRSDWAVSDKTGCIYVYGPSKLDPTRDVGKKITVMGRVMVTKKGQPYLEVRNVQPSK